MLVVLKNISSAGFGGVVATALVESVLPGLALLVLTGGSFRRLFVSLFVFIARLVIHFVVCLVAPFVALLIVCLVACFVVHCVACLVARLVRLNPFPPTYALGPGLVAFQARRKKLALTEDSIVRIKVEFEIKSQISSQIRVIKSQMKFQIRY